MLASKIYLRTYKENPRGADSLNHKLLVRAGMIHQMGNGLFAILPLGKRVIKKIERVVREEMDKVSSEMTLPIVSSSKNWERSGKWDNREILKAFDRKDREYCVVPTAEVDFVNVVERETNSYKDFPISLYQIENKFRDEIRPRFGMLRGREFVMKDAYSFHSNEDCLENTFNQFRDAYFNIFNRLNLDFKMCHADSGAIGGDKSYEFILMTDAGEASVLFCDCGYTANVEKATSFVKKNINAEKVDVEKIETPNCSSMSDVSSFLNKDSKDGLKSIAISIESKPALVVLRGDRELNEDKLRSYLGKDFSYLTEDELKEHSLVKGFMGPKGLNIRVIADEEAIYGLKYAGANEEGYHLTNLLFGRDWNTEEITDVRLCTEGDICPDCKGRSMKFMKGIECGHIFSIGDKYTTPMGAHFTDRDGKKKPILMASYGIGITRLLGAIVEQKAKEDRLVWPKNLAPYQVAIVYNNKNEELAKELYSKLKDSYEVILDDRDLSIGAKIKDFELIGVTSTVVLGKCVSEGFAEISTIQGSKKALLKELEEELKSTL